MTEMNTRSASHPIRKGTGEIGQWEQSVRLSQGRASGEGTVTAGHLELLLDTKYGELYKLHFF